MELVFYASTAAEAKRISNEIVTKNDLPGWANEKRYYSESTIDQATHFFKLYRIRLLNQKYTHLLTFKTYFIANIISAFSG